MVDTLVFNGIEMDYCCFGNGSKSFVIIPGLSVKKVTLSAALIEQGFSKFTEEFTVYLFDRRTNVPDEYSIDQMAEDTILAMKKLGLNNVSIFGASQGGMIAQTIALKAPELVEKIVLASTVSRVNDSINEVLKDWITLAQEKKAYELNESFCKYIYSENTMNAYRDILLSAGNDITPEEMERFVVMASSIKSFDVYGILDQIKCDVLVLGSMGDKVTTPEGSLEIINKLNCSSFMYGEECGHAVFDEAPDFRDRILEFISK